MTRLFTPEEIERKSAANRAAHVRVVKLLDKPRKVDLLKVEKKFAPKKNKYSAIKTEIDGIKFDSRKEAARYQDLKLLEAAGEIQAIERQVPIKLSANGVHICDYVADFRYEETVTLNAGAVWSRVYEDVKGYKTAIYRLKKKLVLALTGIEIRET